MDQAPRIAAHDVGLPPFAAGARESQRLRLATLVRLRWLSVSGQLAACVFVAWGLWWPYPVGLCLALIAASAALNLWLGPAFPKSRRLSPAASAAVLAFDILQPAGLLFLTGGIENPFAVFLVVPVVIASATQPPLAASALAGLAVLVTVVLALFHLPVPWAQHESMVLPGPYVGGLWFAVATTILFAAAYVYRVAAESRMLADALAATELVIQREQHLSALDGLAAAAAHELGTPLATIDLVVKEMRASLEPGDRHAEDVELLIAQSERCRSILRRLATLSSSPEEHLAPLSLTALLEEVAEPHRDFGVEISVETVRGEGPEPVARRNPSLLYGLGNIVENAADFAAGRVEIRAEWDGERVHVSVADDGPGFLPEVLKRIGDPYMSQGVGSGRRGGGGLGLGLFIAKTLLERSGAQVEAANRSRGEGRTGAVVCITWTREAFASRRPAVHE